MGRVPTHVVVILPLGCRTPARLAVIAHVADEVFEEGALPQLPSRYTACRWSRYGTARESRCNACITIGPQIRCQGYQPFVP